MTIEKLKLDEASTLEFDMEVSGTNEKVSTTRFIIEGDQYSVICKCEPTDTGILVKLPKLQNIFEAGTYTAKLEVIIDNKVFTPMTEEVEFEPLIKVSAPKAPKVTKQVVEVVEEVKPEPAFSINLKKVEKIAEVVDDQTEESLIEEIISKVELIEDDQAVLVEEPQPKKKIHKSKGGFALFNKEEE